MPMDSYPDDEIIRLYNSFVESVKSGGDMSEFSEDDLLDIFDYSSGIPDDATAAEALFCGARLYPSSAGLLKRKAFLFHQVGQENACQDVIKRLPEKSFLYRIFNIIETSSGNEIFKDIISAIDQMPSEKVEDGDIMYVVDYFDSINELDFIAEHADNFSRISEYPSTIYNELFHLYWEKGDYAQAAEFGRKVTETEPFNSNAWTELADLYNIQLKDPQAAVECADFALAIDPDSIGAMVVKSSALYERDSEESRAVVSKLVEKAPSDPLVLYAEAILCINDGDKQKGIEKLKRALSVAELSQHRNIFKVLLTVIDEPLKPAQHAMLVGLLNSDDTINATNWCSELISEGSYIGAYEVFRSAYAVQRFDFSMPESFLIGSEVLYRIGNYSGVIDLLKYGFGDQDENLLHLPLPLALMYALSRYRNDINDVEVVKTYLECRIALHKFTPKERTLSERLMDQSALGRMVAFSDALEAGSAPDFRVIDPIG